MFGLFTNNRIRRGYLTLLVKNLIDFKICSKQIHTRMLLNSGEALLYHTKGEETFTFMLRFENSQYHIDRQFNFSRQINETVSTFLNRVDQNISKIINKKKRRKNLSKDESTEIIDTSTKQNIFLYRSNVEINGDTKCEEIVENINNLKLVVYDSPFIIKKNLPMVNSIILPSTLLCGFPSYPTKFEALYTDRKLSEFKWYKKHRKNLKNQWSHVGNGYMYVPNESDIEHRLKLVCIPKHEFDTGPVIEIESKSFVEEGPGPFLCDTRHMFTKNKLTGNSFRVTSYNILADTYARTNFSKETLFAYCPEYALEMDYRKHLILKEIIGFNSDIICLQEVDSKIYNNDFLPILHTLQYKSVFHTKNESPEGLAIFFNEERFEALRFDSIVIGQNLDLPKFATVWSQIKNENMKQRFLERNTIALVTALRSKDIPSEIFVVGNTHLYFHPDADHIRLLQAYYTLEYINNFVEQIKKEHSKINVSIILCGDFNSGPEYGIYQLMTKSYVPEDCEDWSSNIREAVENVSLTHDRCFVSACGTPVYTNYTPTFSACLDYIFYEKNKFEVEQVIPMPSKEELALYEGLPSPVSPSDHISLCADLKRII